MAAPKGNQYAKGNPNSGRPRTVCPETDEELIAIGDDLQQWARIERDESDYAIRTRFAQFYTSRKILRKVWKQIVVQKVFTPYYEEAQAILAARCMNKDIMSEGFGQRLYRLYERDLVAEENDNKRFEADLRKEVAQEFDGKVAQMLDFLQKVKSEDDFDNKAKPKAD